MVGCQKWRAVFALVEKRKRGIENGSRRKGRLPLANCLKIPQVVKKRERGCHEGQILGKGKVRGYLKSVLQLKRIGPSKK